MRVADYVMNRIYEEGTKEIFMLSGGGIMYLVDALGRSKIEHVCCHHEQAAAIAAESYAITKGGLGVCLITTGPGGTNALTATGASYVDSTPVLFISGQVKTADFASKRNVRQFGAQENDIVSMAKPVTKYAITVENPEDIRYHLEKAIFLALHGRKGPVWLDIPLDVQNADIIPDKLKGFEADELNDSDILIERNGLSEEAKVKIADLLEDVNNSKRPLFIVGSGLNGKTSYNLFKKVQSKLNIPVLTTWRVMDLYDYEDEYYFGSPGLQANRYSNIITQGADLIIVIGSRLDNMITAFSESHFGYRAKKYIIDIDINEINKLDMPNKVAINAHAFNFLEHINESLTDCKEYDFTQWLDFCRRMKTRFPILSEKQETVSDMVDLYQMTMNLSDYCKKEDTIVVSSTSRCNTAGHIAFKHKAGQKTVSCMGFGSMGYALPCVIGSWYASNKNRVIMIEGDGSLQLNIQELQTIVHYGINAKMFIFRNEGYAAIATMQNRNFDGFHVGCDAESGVSMPNLRKVSEAYGIPYFSITRNEDIPSVLEKVMNTDKYTICEFIGDIAFDEIPKCISSLDENGNRVSAVLENPYPFLSETELNEIYSDL